MSFASGLPPVDASQLPADVRAAPPARRSAYEAGLGFEQLLVQQLSQSLTDSSGNATSSDGSAGDSGGLGGDSPYASLLPDALTSGVMDAGGLGLARQLMDAIAPAAPTPTSVAPATPATPAPTPPSAPSSGSASGGASFPA